MSDRKKILGCWLGKAAGGTLGQPYEGCEGPLALTFYDPVPTDMIPNDDLDLQVLWACVLAKMEKPVINREIFARAWLNHIEFCYDEYGFAIRNLQHGVMPPHSGVCDNWFKDGLGAAIRSEIWACLAPGNPELAARYACEDACVDHTGDGIYAAQFLAAAESMAFIENDLIKIINVGLSVIPADSRLARAIRDTVKWCGECADSLVVRSRIPAYAREIGAVPSVMAAYFDVWRWLKEGAEAAELHITGKVSCENSLNIIADFPGNDPDGGIIYTGGHLDSQAGTPGADDNGSGLVFQLELARVLAPLKLRRTIRHISFGAEEQLSVGSAAYAWKHLEEISRNGCFMFNADSCGSLLGWTVINYNGPEHVQTMLAEELAKVDMCAEFSNETVPFTDQFPFAVCGVPGLWLYRKNCSSGNWYHHRPENNLDVVSPEVIAAYVDMAAAFIIKLAEPEICPVERLIPAVQSHEIARCWNDLFGGW